MLRIWTRRSTPGRRAVDATPPGHPNLATVLSTLGNSLLHQFERTGDTAALDAAIGYWRRASQMPSGTPQVQMAAGAGRAREAAEGYKAAVGMLPLIAWHGLR